MSGNSPERKSPSNAEEGDETEIMPIMRRLHALLWALETNPPYHLPVNQVFECELYKEIAALSARLVAMGAAECPNPYPVVVAALDIDRFEKHRVRLRQLLDIWKDLNKMTKAGKVHPVISLVQSNALQAEIRCLPQILPQFPGMAGLGTS